MGRMVIEGAHCLDGRRRTFILDDGSIEEIHEGRVSGEDSDRTIDASDLLIMPGLCNSHTHAPMTLLKGIGEDLELKEWLQNRIWPMESRMTLDHLRSGLSLACLEMIRTGTTLFNDMYFRQGEVADIVRDMGLRAVLGEGFIDLFDEERREQGIKGVRRSLEAIDNLNCGRVKNSMSPHAVYTVSEEGLRWCKEEAEKRELIVHTHISETENEVKECSERFGGTPMGILKKCGLLENKLIGAHCVHLTEVDMDLAAENGVGIAHAPISNMKLSVGGQLKYPDIVRRGIRVALGTDGSASNNSLDMFSTMKMMGLLCKQRFGASSISAHEIINAATRVGYEALGINGGTLSEGKLADLILIDMKDPTMVPCHSPESNVVYSVQSSAVCYSIVNGHILMDNRKIDRQERIITEAIRLASDLGGDHNE